MLKIFRICNFKTRQWILVESSRLSAWVYFSVFSPYSASLHVTHYNRSQTTTSCFPSAGPYIVWTITICGNNAIRSWIVTHLRLHILLLLLFFMSLLHSILKAKWTSPLTWLTFTNILLYKLFKNLCNWLRSILWLLLQTTEVLGDATDTVLSENTDVLSVSEIWVFYKIPHQH